VLCSSFSLANVEQLARNVNARAREERVWARCCVVLRYTYICIVKERKKERERNWMSMMCVWVRETSFGCRREKREKRSSFYKTQDKKGEEIIVSFSRRGDAAI